MSDRVQIETVTVGQGGGRPLLADLYRPPAPNGAAVLLIHGGGFVSGDRAQLRGYGIYLGRQGFTCLACEYRLAPASKWPAQIDDAHSALQYLHDQASSLGVDPARIAISGNSAGGYLSLLMAGMRKLPMAAAVAFYSPADFNAGRPEAAEALEALLGDDLSEERLRSVSPISYAAASFPPTLLITGNADDVVDAEGSLRMYRALVEHGAPAELHVFEGMSHAFDLQPEYGRQCAAIVALFLCRHLLQGA